MDIHRPKAAHSLREFLIEIGTIVCGVLIAIGLEQIVEQVHWSHEVEAERAALRNEARDNVTTAAYRVAEDHCITLRLAEIEGGFSPPGEGSINRISFGRDQATVMDREHGQLGHRRQRASARAHADQGKAGV